MDEPSPFLGLSLETKVLVLVKELQCKSLHGPQLRAILHGMVCDDHEKKEVLDRIAECLRTAGQSPQQIAQSLAALNAPEAEQALQTSLRRTRRLRSPFSIRFENVPLGNAQPEAPAPERKQDEGQSGKDPGATPG